MGSEDMNIAIQVIDTTVGHSQYHLTGDPSELSDLSM